MNLEVLYLHLCELGVSLSFVKDGLNLDVDAPAGTLTPELVALMAEHKAALVEIVYEREERGAIEAEGCEAEERLRRWARTHPAFRLLSDHLGGLEILDVRRVA